MQITELKAEFDRLQKKFGDPGLSSIYGAGCITKPDICFVFMNPTGKNVAADPKWTGLRAPWIGTKNVWKLFFKLNLLPQDIFNEIQAMRGVDWTPDFSHHVYSIIARQGLYITNLSKSTQTDARPLPDSLFKEYLPAFYKEIATIRPKCIITFGNQVSSILLQSPIKVSEARRLPTLLTINETEYPVYPTFYPVGQGMRNMDKAVEDIKWIIEAPR